MSHGMMGDNTVMKGLKFLWIFLAIDCSNRSAECPRAAGDIFVNYREILKSKLNQLKSESRYRTFVELERQTGWHPHALWNGPDGPKDVIIWCSNDYLGMGQNPHVVKALAGAIDAHGTGAGGTRNISGTSAAIVALENELADLHGKERALVLTSGRLSAQGLSLIHI